MITLTRTLYTALKQAHRGEQIPADLRFRLTRLDLLDTVGRPTELGLRALAGEVHVRGIEVG